MTSGLPDLLARIAVDADFAAFARLHPEQVAQQYGLDSAAVAMLQSVDHAGDAGSGEGPGVLGERLSRSPLFFGGALSSLLGDKQAPAAAGDEHLEEA